MVNDELRDHRGDDSGYRGGYTHPGGRRVGRAAMRFTEM